MKKYLFAFVIFSLVYNVFAEFYYVKVNALNVRSKPTKNSKVIKVLKKGNKVNVLKKSNNWAKIDENEWTYLPLLSTHFVSKEKLMSSNNISKISNYDIKKAVCDFCSPLICSNWSIGKPKDAIGEPNYAVQVYCDCEHPDVPNYILNAHFYVLISKTTLKPVSVIDVYE